MLKRVIDVLVSVCLLIVLAPFFLSVAALIKLDSPGPVIHRARRVGKDGRLFSLYKFRTMVVDAANRGPGITRSDDPRITRIGRLLRTSKADEFLQLFNVLKGDMSLVGPRPEDPRFVALYNSEQKHVLSVRPGIASPSSVKYRHEEEILAAIEADVENAYVSVILPDKLVMDLEYIRRGSLVTDIAVLARVAVSLLSPKSKIPKSAGPKKFPSR